MSEGFPPETKESRAAEDRDGASDQERVMGKRPLITLIIPTRNEAENITPLLDRITQATKTLALELLFVDDSDDHTANMIKLLAKQFPLPVRVLERTPAQQNGLTGAIIDGIKLARGEWICVMDADLQHPPEVIPQLLAQAQRSGSQLVVGSRKADLIGPLGLSPKRAFTSHLLTLFARLLFPRQLKSISDLLTGLFLVRRKAVDVAQLRPDGFKILLELLIHIPDIYVSEVRFDFGERHEGHSKADWHEGLRFLHHLLRLRLTTNTHIWRWLLVGMSGLAGNMVLLIAFTQRLGVHHLLSTILATECATLWSFYWDERWVFRDRQEGNARHRLHRYVVMNQLFLLLIRLPLVWMLVTWGWANYIAANLLSIGVVSLIRYLLAEQWIWTRRLVLRPLTRFYYNIHGLVGISTPVRLPTLDYFMIPEPLTRVDIYVRLDRFGTPRCLPGALCYDEGLGRFGFGVAIMQGEAYSEVMVSPLLERSPQALYDHVIEPVLRWTLVRKGYALINGACGVFKERGVLVTASAETDVAGGMLEMIQRHNGAFMAGNGVILGQNGRLLCFPKPISPAPSNEWQPAPSVQQRVGQWLQAGSNHLYPRWLTKLHFPLATFHAYRQRYLPPPRMMAEDLVPGLAYCQEAALSLLVLVNPATQTEPVSTSQAVKILQQNNESAYTLPPHPALITRLSSWRGQDLAAAEREIIESALRSRVVRRVVSKNGRWWEQANGQHFTGAGSIGINPLSPEF
ncbi:MAG: glycosyltransferase [Anaerolineales bacterium]|nr:glycosyltransferase [Anaerolineales bacterium]